MAENAFLRGLAGFDGTALIYDNKATSYADLLLEIRKFEKILADLPPKSLIALKGDFEPKSVAFLLSNLSFSHILGLISQNDSQAQSKIDELKFDYVFENGKLEKLKFEPCENADENADFRAKFEDLKGEPGLIIFSSGSTGKPKAIMHNLANLAANFAGKKPKKIAILLFLMFDHIGGINTLFNALAMGASGVAVKNRKSSREIGAAIERYKITLLPASVSLLNLLLMSDIKSEFDLKSLKMITYGTEKMPDALLERLKNYFCGVKFHQTFGTSEVGISQSKSVGNAIKLEMDYKIINGELFLRSKTQALGYLNSDNAAFLSDGYFATGDLVEREIINGEEYLKIIGRTKELINIGGEKVVPSEVESALLEIAGIKDALVFGVKNAITGQILEAKIVVDENLSNLSKFELKTLLKNELKARLSAYKIPAKFEVVENLEINSRGKKERK